jgi:hypothetical protein
MLSKLPHWLCEGQPAEAAPSPVNVLRYALPPPMLMPPGLEPDEGAEDWLGDAADEVSGTGRVAVGISLKTPPAEEEAVGAGAVAAEVDGAVG